ncbi:hypothetical protein BAE44_0024792 [Dichanthelium oligosanthes]|uniref:Uncharacterized protein n=1 Tax=Dichanthelium oligosanthes TaxID=888268 RepID=A0A1E5UMS7_9POAL|nr:hypothetical protein BAE44_0024792 [Dichanthelium oligosanthes]
MLPGPAGGEPSWHKGEEKRYEAAQVAPEGYRGGTRSIAGDGQMRDLCAERVNLQIIKVGAEGSPRAVATSTKTGAPSDC